MPDDLDPDSADPLYAQLATALRNAIARGVYARRLPAETALAEEYGVSRDTVRHALDLLAADGLVRRSHGRGTFVISKRSRG
jgi:GntR family transcriptional regulator